MKFPDRPTCHDGDPRFSTGLVAWQTRTQRGPADKDHYGEPPGPDAPNPFRSCNHCGSLHPEDLVTALRGGAKMGGSGWKYGYPHKFYVSDIPNPTPDTMIVGSISSGGGKPTVVEWRKAGLLWGKFYSDHLADDGFDDEARDIVCLALTVHTGITFAIIDGRLKYAAPHHGYQR